MAIKTIVPFQPAGFTPPLINAIGTTYSRAFPEIATADTLIMILDVTAFSGTGTPTLDVTLEEYDPQSGKWTALPSPMPFTQVTGTVTQRIVITDFGTSLRARFVAGGATISVSFTLTGIKICNV